MSSSFNASDMLQPHQGGLRSAASSPGARRAVFVDETTPLLAASPPEDGVAAVRKKRGLWASIFRGELSEDDARRGFVAVSKRFWSPIGERRYWKAMVHLWFLNFPFVRLSPLVERHTLTGVGSLGVATLSRWDSSGDRVAHHPPSRCRRVVVDVIHRSIRCAS